MAHLTYWRTTAAAEQASERLPDLRDQLAAELRETTVAFLRTLSPERAKWFSQ